MSPHGQLHTNKHARGTVSDDGRFAVVFGYRLETGDVLQPDDVYDSTSGFWESCPCPGLTLQEGNATVWIRPENPEAG